MNKILLIGWLALAQRSYCSNAAETFKEYLPTINDCAAACEGEARYFVYGTSENSNSDCENGCCNSDGCKCYCQNTGSEICSQSPYNGYDLFAYSNQQEGKSNSNIIIV